MAAIGFATVALAVALMIVGTMNLAQRPQPSERRVGVHGWSFILLGLGCGAGAAEVFYLYGFQ